MPEIHVKSVFWKSFYKDDIQSEIQVAPRNESNGETDRVYT